MTGVWASERRGARTLSYMNVFHPRTEAYVKGMTTTSWCATIPALSLSLRRAARRV